MPTQTSVEQVVYCGDLDTHGFAILSLLRGQVLQTQSLLMDPDPARPPRALGE